MLFDKKIDETKTEFKQEFKTGLKQMIQESKMLLFLTANTACLIAGFVAGAVATGAVHKVVNRDVR